LHSSSSRLRYVVVSWPCFICHLCFSCLVLPSRALATPRFVVAAAERTFPGCAPVRLGWAVPGDVLLRAVATCCWCLALGSYVAVFLALEALLHSALSLISLALSLISLALEHLALLDQTLVYGLVRVFWLSELDSDGRCGLGGSVSSQLSYVTDLSSRDERSVVL
jgi:hypothetical protein